MTTPGDVFKQGDCLLVIDVQNDFCPGGRLAIDDGDAVVPVMNRYIDAALERNIPVYLSRDWHPAGHVSFAEAGGQWPPHCVQDTHGAKFHPDLKVPESAMVITKGVRFDKDQNSAFDETGLTHKLKKDGIRRVVVGGLALDVCILATVQDALSEGFSAVVSLSGTRPVTPEGGGAAIEKMKAAGAEVIPE